MKKLIILLSVVFIMACSPSVDAYNAASRSFRHSCIDNTITVSLQPVEGRQALIAMCEKVK